MANVRLKTVINMRAKANASHHARTEIEINGRTAMTDEPVDRGGTDQGPSPTETLVVALSGCLSVIGHRIADNMGIELEDLNIEVDAQFDRRGVTFQEAIEVPFPQIDVTFTGKTNATDAQIQELSATLAKHCPLSVVLRQAGTVLNENWQLTQR